MTEKPELTFVNSYDELLILSPGDKTKVRIDSDNKPEWMIYKGKEKNPYGESYHHSFIDIPDTLENDTKFEVWSSDGKYLSFSGDECITHDLKNSIIFNHLYRKLEIITRDSEEYDVIKNLVELWIK